MTTKAHFQNIIDVLTNMQPHIPQCCETKRLPVIDGYVDRAIEEAEQGLKIAEAADDAYVHLHHIADVVERHWKGAGLPLHSKWIIDEILALASRKEDCSDALDERNEALIRLAYDKSINPLAGNPAKWPFTVAYRALGGRIENGCLLDTEDDLRGRNGLPPRPVRERILAIISTDEEPTKRHWGRDFDTIRKLCKGSTDDDLIKIYALLGVPSKGEAALSHFQRDFATIRAILGQ